MQKIEYIGIAKKESHIIRMIWEFLLEPIRKASSREGHGHTINGIAEFYCTMSMIPLFLVAFYYLDAVTFFAALFSALSHTFSYQRLHDLDIFGVVLVGIKMIWHVKKLLLHKYVIAIAGLALLINPIDTYLSRNHLWIRPLPHVIWHLGITIALDLGLAVIYSMTPLTQKMILAFVSIFVN